MESFQGNIHKASASTQELYEILQDCLRHGIKITAAWVPSHCGIRENKQADKFAATAAAAALSAHQAVTSLGNLRATTRISRKSTLVSINTTENSIHGISIRRADVLVNQILTRCSPLGKSFRTAEHTDFTCMSCNLYVKETVERMMLHCPGRRRARNQFFGRKTKLDLAELCTKHPEQVLGYLYDVGLLAKPSPQGSHN